MPALRVPAHDPFGGGETVGAASPEADCVNMLDRLPPDEQVGLACARATATNVAPCRRAARARITVVPVAHPRSRRWW